VDSECKNTKRYILGFDHGSTMSQGLAADTLQTAWLLLSAQVGRHGHVSRRTGTLSQVLVKCL
jgi:hypothetical protein